MPPSPPPTAATHSSSSPSLFIVGVAILGILSTSAFLLTYYIFVIKCCLNWRHSDLLLRLFSASRRRPFSSDAAESTGLDPSTIRAIPTFIYSSVPAASSAAECAICLSEFHSGERLRLLPGCAHAFHIDCIDRWLQSNTSCPLCRTHITDSSPAPADYSSIPAQSSAIEAGGEAPGNPGRTLEHAVSMGDECIDARREKDELLAGQPLRRSLSLDSSCHRHLYISVQDILRRNPDMLAGNACGQGGGGGDGGSGRARRSFFPFGHCRSSRIAVVLPAGLDV